MIDRVNQHAHAQHVRGEDEFLPLLRGQLAGAGEPIDRGCPFRLRRLDVAHEAVQVLDQRLHDLAQARIGDVRPALQRHVGEVVFGYVGHGHLLEAVVPACWRVSYRGREFHVDFRRAEFGFVCNALCTEAFRQSQGWNL
jgi:hypothetical protein